jgi:hypothetical protein
MQSLLALALLRPSISTAFRRHNTVRTPIGSRGLRLHVRRLEFHASFAQSSAELAQGIILFTSHNFLAVTIGQIRFHHAPDPHPQHAGTTPPPAAGVVKNFQIFSSINITSNFVHSSIIQVVLIVNALRNSIPRSFDTKTTNVRAPIIVIGALRYSTVQIRFS